MIINQLVDEDFVNYRKPAMYIGFPKCSFKCDKECGKQVCQNGVLATSPTIEVNIKDIVNRYVNNLITESVIIAGLEPFDTFEQLKELILNLRECTNDDIVIYSGYYKEEIEQYIEILKQYSNIIIKFGRYIPDQQSKFDRILEIDLVSDNQYAEIIS